MLTYIWRVVSIFNERTKILRRCVDQTHRNKMQYSQNNEHSHEEKHINGT